MIFMVRYVNKENCRYFSELHTMVFKGSHFNSKLAAALAISPEHLTSTNALNCKFWLEQSDNYKMTNCTP